MFPTSALACVLSLSLVYRHGTADASVHSSSSVVAFATNIHNRRANPDVGGFHFASTSSLRAGAGAGNIPSWEDLKKSLNPRSIEMDAPSAVDGRAFSSRPKPSTTATKLTLYRERHGWCPYSERVWMALEALDVDYDTIFIDNIYGRPSWYSGNTPQIQWHDSGKFQSESMDLVREINKKFAGDKSITDLYPKQIESEVINKVRAFDNIFPSRTRPSSRAAFLFRYDGEPLWKNEFEKVLREADELLSETAASGPFFCGNVYTAADIAWAPFLERYAAQLPALHEGLNPRCPDTYPYLSAWYNAMESDVEEYSCRIQGDASSWRKVLTMAGFGNAGSVPALVSERMDQLHQLECGPIPQEMISNEKEIWDKYSARKSWVASTPSREAASTLIRNREAIVKDISKSSGEHGLPPNKAELDEAMRSLAFLLTDDDDSGSTIADKSIDSINMEHVRGLAGYLDERMCVPRDMGRLSAACIKRLAYNDYGDLV